MKNKQYLAIGLGNAATQQLVIGALSAAERDLRRRIDLSREIADERSEAVGHRELGRVLFYHSEWNDSEQEIETAEKLFEKEKNVQSLSVTWSYRALRFLLLGRQTIDDRPSSTVHRQSSIECAQRALELAEERHKNIGRPNIRDYVRAYWLLGAAYRASVVSIRPANNVRNYSTTELESLTLAEENLSKALNLCRQINSVDSEADIILDLARLRYDQKNYGEAKSFADEALLMTVRCGYVLHGADVNMFLAQFALEQEQDKAKAKAHAEEALNLASCDGPPFY
jgi:tetratricopeptide (TPR) repeat protein